MEPSAGTGTSGEQSRGIRWTLSFLPARLGEGLTGPLLPIYAAALAGASPANIGLMEATYQGLSVLGAFLWGRTSDDVGKRKAFILLGFGGVALSMVGIGFADTFWAVFIWRALQGLVIAAYAAVGGALIADAATEETIGSRMGQFQTVGGIGYVGGLVLGAYVLTLRPATDAFLLAGIATALALVLALAWIDEPEAHLRRREVHTLLSNARIPFTMGVQRRMFTPSMLLKRPKLSRVETRAWAYLGATALAFLGTSSGFVLFPLYLVEIGLDPSTVFLLFILNAGLSAALYRPMGRLSDRVGYRPVQLAAVGTRSLMFAFLALPLGNDVAGAVVFLSLAGISWAVMNTTGPAALFRGMQIRRKGELLALYSMAVGIGSLGGALLGGWLAGAFGFQTVFVIAAALVAISVVILATAVYPPGPQGEDGTDGPSTMPT